MTEEELAELMLEAGIEPSEISHHPEAGAMIKLSAVRKLALIAQDTRMEISTMVGARNKPTAQMGPPSATGERTNLYPLRQTETKDVGQNDTLGRTGAPEMGPMREIVVHNQP